MQMRNTMQCIMPRHAIQCDTLRCNTTQGNVVYCIALHGVELECSILGIVVGILYHAM